MIPTLIVLVLVLLALAQYSKFKYCHHWVGGGKGGLF